MAEVVRSCGRNQKYQIILITEVSNLKIDKKRSLDTLSTLIKINTVNPPGDEVHLANYIKEYVEGFDLNTDLKAISKDRSNIIVKLKGSDPTRPSLIFSGHLDTVPIGEINSWEQDPFSATIKKGKLYGRGSCDMKGGVSAILEAMISLKEQKFTPKMDVIFVGTVGEEVDCLGSKTIVENNDISNPGAMIIAEPSNNKIFTAHKGAFWLNIRIYGKTAHGSMPKEGKNSILAAKAVIDKIYNLQFMNDFKNVLLGPSTVNVSMINGGVNTNVVPDYCSLTVDFRTIPGVEHKMIYEDIQNILADMKNKENITDWNIEILHDLPPLSNKKGDDFIDLVFNIKNESGKLQSEELGANYYTDGSIYGEAYDIPIIIYGPGNEKLAHQPNEYVKVDNYIESIETYINVVKQYSKASK